MVFEAFQYAAPHSHDKTQDSKKAVGFAPTRVLDSRRGRLSREAECVESTMNDVLQTMKNRRCRVCPTRVELFC